MTRQDEPEDVLLSIRRAMAGGTPAPEPAAAPRHPILLLGPAVRVTGSGDAFEMIHRRAGGDQTPVPRREEGLAGTMRVGGGDAALRALVTQVVREELAGELGQRITRNLRHLVLRELRAANGPDAPRKGTDR